MTTNFLHGAEVVEIDVGPRPITTVRSGVIGLVVTAPKGPVNTPVLIPGRPGLAAETFGLTSQSEGFTAYPSVEGVCDQTGAVMVLVNVLDPATHKTSVAAVSRTFGDAGVITLPQKWVRNVVLGTSITAQYTLSGSPGTVTLPAGHTVGAVKSADGVTTYTLTTDYTVSGTTVTRVGSGGAIPAGATLRITSTVSSLSATTDYTVNSDAGTVTRVTGGKIPAGASLTVAHDYADPTKVELTDVIGDPSDFSGVYALLRAKSSVKVDPRIIAAPGFTAGRPDGEANPVTAALDIAAQKLKAIAVVDVGNGTYSEAVTYREDWGSRRIYGVYPYGRVLDSATGVNVDQPLSARVCGVMSRIHNEKGFWWSPSNNIINGILGLSQPVDFQMGDANSLANLLNENRVTTVIQESGYRLWGNRTFADDAKWTFVNVVVTADLIGDSLLRAHLWAIDRNITRTYFEEVAEGVNAYLRQLKAEGAILGGRCWPDPDLNSKAAIQDGKVYFNFDFTPPYPAEHVTFRSILTPDYLDVLIQEIQQAA